MYVPKHFEETRTDVLHSFMRAHPFATLVTRTADGLEANHIPFHTDAARGPFGTLVGHVARANPVWKQTLADEETLVVFQGPHGYVSPSWYPTKRETGKVVPTWNYAAVHAYGRVRFIEDRLWLRGLVVLLTTTHELGRPEPWAVDDAPADFIEAMLGGIVGVEILVTRLVGKRKLSQNRPREDRRGVVAGLSAEPSGGTLGQLMGTVADD